jgi:hypothetical protein
MKPLRLVNKAILPIGGVPSVERWKSILNPALITLLLKNVP